MRYLIGYLIRGEAGEWHTQTRRAISERFGTWPIHEAIPSHITVQPPFWADDIAPAVRFLEAWAGLQKDPGTIAMNDYGHFDDRVVFATVRPDLAAEKTFADLRKRLPTFLPPDPHDTWTPHATLATKIPTPETVLSIWEHVQTLPKPDFVMPFDNVTILRKEADGWEVEKTIELPHA